MEKVLTIACGLYRGQILRGCMALDREELRLPRTALAYADNLEGWALSESDQSVLRMHQEHEPFRPQSVLNLDEFGQTCLTETA